MEQTVGQLVQAPHNIKILDSLLPGGLGWYSFKGDCLRSCPHFKACKGYGPDGNICSSDWRTSEPTPLVLDVVHHVLDNFDHYNQSDLPKLTRASPSVTLLTKFFSNRVIETVFEEGSPKLRMHYYRERRSKAAKTLKDKALASRAVICGGCKRNFFNAYGALSIALIECHHTIPLSSSLHGGVTKVKDLVLLCANCHRLIHTKQIALSMIRLRAVAGSVPAMRGRH